MEGWVALRTAFLVWAVLIRTCAGLSADLGWLCSPDWLAWSCLFLRSGSWHCWQCWLKLKVDANCCGVLICWYCSTDRILLKRLENPEVLCWLSSTCMEVIVKSLVGLNANVSCLKGPCWSSTTRTDADCDDADSLCTWGITITVGGCGAATSLGWTACVELEHVELLWPVSCVLQPCTLFY